jgi:ribosomal protein S6--L-glutamate ligase
MKNKIFIGWQEWCSLPELNIKAIKAKVDTGARTSALHAFNIELYTHNKIPHVKFCIHPLQRDDKIQIACQARLVDEREVVSSNGHRERRYVIETPLTLGDATWNIQITLSNRDPMKFRMLLGREALGTHVLIDPCKKLCQNTLNDIPAKKLYKKFSSKK